MPMFLGLPSFQPVVLSKASIILCLSQFFQHFTAMPPSAKSLMARLPGSESPPWHTPRRRYHSVGDTHPSAAA